MAQNRIKGLTVEIGGDTTKLGKALDGVNSKGSDLSKELKNINSLLKLDPTNVDLLTQKQKVLAEAIRNTEEKLDTLREAEKQVQAQFERGEVSEAQYRELQREIAAAEIKLKQYTTAVEKAADATENLGDKTEHVAEELADEKQKADTAEDSTRKLGESAAEAAKAGLTALATAATAVVTGIVAMAEASRDYRAEQGKLIAAYTSSGFSAENASVAYEELQSVIGETDQAVEAAQQIALLADSEKDVAEWAKLAAGVVGKFGDALQPETFYEAANETMKLGEATGAYTQMLEGVGMNVEEFNKGLAACTTEEQKQKYMLDTTRKALGTAADQYKRTNTEVIRANAATEKWNATVAKIGGHVEPVVTDIKEFGAALLEDAEAPIKAIANFVRDNLLPAIDSAKTWVQQNIPAISSTMAGLTAAFVIHKVSVLAVKTATEGVTVATYLQIAAQKALDAVMAASPWGLVATLVGGVTAALVVLAATTEDSAAKADVLTEEERELMESAEKAAEAFRNQQEATQKTMGGITSQMDYVRDLAEELQGLADASGQVKDADQARAEFILNEMNSALSTEYTMVDGVIQQYDSLKSSIENVIQSKLADALLESASADYIAAVENKQDAYASLILAQEDYQAQLQTTQEKERAYAEAVEAWNAAMEAGNHYEIESAMQRKAMAESAYEAEKETLEKKKSNYDQFLQDYEIYVNTISNYEDAQAAALAGNYQTTVDLLVKKSEAYSSYADSVDEETARVLEALRQEAIDAGLEAANIKKNFEDGVAGYTASMVKEAETNYAIAMSAFATAYEDATGIGVDITQGLIDGMEGAKPGLLEASSNLAKGIPKTMRVALDSHSPSRKAIAVTEDVGDGAVIGLENKTKDVARAADNQAEAILDAYRSQEVSGQNALRGIAERQASAAASSHMSAAAANAPLLEKILAAIEHGQVLVLDGDKVVGGTLDRTDNMLGRRRELIEMGAL